MATSLTRKILGYLFEAVQLSVDPRITITVGELRKSRGELGAKVAETVESLQQASALVEELEISLSGKIEKVNQLKKEYDRFSKLAAVEEEKASALIIQVQEAVDNGKSKERMIGIGISLATGIVIFVLGIWLSPWVTDLLGVGGEV